MNSLLRALQFLTFGIIHRGSPMESSEQTQLGEGSLFLGEGLGISNSRSQKSFGIFSNQRISAAAAGCASVSV